MRCINNISRLVHHPNKNNTLAPGLTVRLGNLLKSKPLAMRVTGVSSFKSFSNFCSVFDVITTDKNLPQYCFS
jgi:hypothetical protein